MAVVRSPVVIAVALLGALAVAIPLGLLLHNHARHHSFEATAAGQSLTSFPVYRLMRARQDTPGRSRPGEEVVPAAGITPAFDVLARRPLASLKAQYAWVTGSNQLFIVQIYAPHAASLTGVAGRGQLAGIIDGVAVQVRPVQPEPGGGPNLGLSFRTASEAEAFAGSLTTHVTNYTSAI